MNLCFSDRDALSTPVWPSLLCTRLFNILHELFCVGVFQLVLGAVEKETKANASRSRPLADGGAWFTEGGGGSCRGGGDK